MGKARRPLLILAVCALAISGCAENGANGDEPFRYVIQDSQKISDTKGNFTGALNDGDGFGWSVANIDDLNGDGNNELAVGALRDDGAGSDRGAVWILFLNDDGTVATSQEISGTAGGFGGTLDDGDFMGWEVAGIGDLDADSVPDLAVGAPYDDDGGTDRGASWILFLDNDGTVAGEQKISAMAGGFGGSLDDSDLFGSGLSHLGDIDGDGTIELAVGSQDDDDAGSDRGAVWIVSVKTDGTVASEQKISATAGGFGGSLADYDAFGESTTRLDDMNDDGIPELGVGAPFTDSGGTDRGAAWVLSLRSDGTVASEQKIGSGTGGFEGTVENSDIVGWDVAAVGDLNGDDAADLISTAPRDSDGGTDRGALWLLYLRNDGTVDRHRKISDTSGGFTGVLSDDDRFGSSAVPLGDLNDDGYPDLAVGAWKDADGGTDRGAVWILFGGE
jgi:hypothetical protein